MQSTKSTDAIIADSISSLRLKPKGGAEIYCQHENSFSGQEIYNDLRKCLFNCIDGLELGKTEFDPIKYFSTPQSIDIIIKMFREMIVPAGFDFEIRNNDREFFFVIFKELDSVNEWIIIVLKNTIERLEKNNKELHDLFIEFIKIFKLHTGISAWYEWVYSGAADWLEERIMECDQDMEQGNDPDIDMEYYTDTKKTITEYKEGKPAFYQKKLNGKYKRVDTVTKRLKNTRFRGKNKKLAEMMIRGCELIKKPYSIGSYNYRTEDKEDLMGLEVEGQFGIFWDVADRYFDETEEWINVNANEGHFPPTIHLFCVKDKKIEKGSIEWLRNGEDWIIELINFIHDLNELLNV